VFLSLKEYMLYLESTSAPLLSAYLNLLQIPEDVPVEQTPEFQRNQVNLRKSNLGQIGGRVILETNLNDWSLMTPYWKWVAELYHAGMARKFGSLAAVDMSLIPLGVVKVLRQQKIRWQG